MKKNNNFSYNLMEAAPAGSDVYQKITGLITYIYNTTIKKHNYSELKPNLQKYAKKFDLTDYSYNYAISDVKNYADELLKLNYINDYEFGLLIYAYLGKLIACANYKDPQNYVVDPQFCREYISSDKNSIRYKIGQVRTFAGEQSRYRDSLDEILSKIRKIPNFGGITTQVAGGSPQSAGGPPTGGSPEPAGGPPAAGEPEPAGGPPAAGEPEPAGGPPSGGTPESSGGPPEPSTPYAKKDCPQTEDELLKQKGIKYRCVSPLIGELQTKFGRHPILKEVLQKGTTSRSYDNLRSRYVDNKYGPRTELTFAAALKIFKGEDKQSFGEFLTYDQYQKLKEITVAEVAAKSFSMSEVETIVAPLKRIVSTDSVDSASMAVESVSYRKDLLKPTKNRHKELEKLVFERLVKGCK